MAHPHPSATRTFHNRIVLVFDFDRTLSSGTIDALLERMGVDGSRWRKERLAPMIEDDWDEILAKGWLLKQTADELGIELTKELMEEVGRSLDCYPGVEEALGALREAGKEASGGADVEIYVLSSGFVDIMTASPAANHVDGVWGSSLHWDIEGRLNGVKRAIIHSEKARYLRALAKGLDIKGANEPQDVFRDKPAAEWHVPLDQMIYVGDGASDLDAFRLLQSNGGIALAVDQSSDDEDWDAKSHISDEARVENLAPPDFTDGSEMRRSLILAVQAVGKIVALRRLGKRE